MRLCILQVDFKFELGEESSTVTCKIDVKPQLRGDPPCHGPGRSGHGARLCQGQRRGVPVR